MAIAAGKRHSLALLSDGTVIAWGGNGYGESTVPGALENVVGIDARSFHSLALSSDGTVTGWGLNTDGQINVPGGLENVVAIAAGSWHSLALSSDGTVTAWGDNYWGQTDIPGGLENVVGISGGGNHSLALSSDGSVTAWGYNGNGESTVPGDLENVVAIAAGNRYSVALLSDGTVTAWGYNGYGESTVPGALENVVGISGGYGHTLALSSDGSVTAWGYNYYGQTYIPGGLTALVYCNSSGDVEDCAGVCGGSGYIDECGVCGGDNSTCSDECGVLNGNNSSCADCAGTPNGSAAVDNCGTCDSDSSNDCTQDCSGAWGGDSVLSGCDNACGSTLENDECGICDGDNSSCADCAGVPNGDTEIDECGVCDGDSSSCDDGCGPNQPGPSGCDMACGSTAIDDACGVCGGDGSDDLGCGCFEPGPSGCDNVCGSTAIDDACGVCGGDGSDDLGCGCFEPGPSGCDNVCGSTLENDACGVCDGDGSSCLYCVFTDAEGNCMDYNVFAIENAFYHFNSITLGGELIEDGDWLIARKGELLVGAVEMGSSPNAAPNFVNSATNAEIVVNGELVGNMDGWSCDSGPINTCDMMLYGETPQFYIYESGVGEHLAHYVSADGTQLQDIPAFGGNDFNINLTLNLVLDCIADMGGAAVTSYCGDCWGGNSGNDCVLDCAGVWGGIAVIDNCGVCDNDSSNDCVQDCNGDWGGYAFEDDCGVCDSDNTNNNQCLDCNSVPNGGAYIDNCNECILVGEDSSCVLGCDGNWNNNGLEINYDECGVCGGDDSTCTDECGVPNGDNSTCLDCNDVPNGNAELDNCGVCDISPSNDCVQDCYGAWGGSAELDECGVCGGDGPADNYDCDGNCTAGVDCNGDCGDEAYINNCNICVEGNTGYDYNQGEDCMGVCFGNSYYFDDCGVHCGDNSSCSGCMDPTACNYDATATIDGGCWYDDGDYDCEGNCIVGIDCTGNCGTAFENECGVCVGGNTGFEEDSGLDCNGICFGGSNYVDDCGVYCGDNSSCTDCNGDINGTAEYDNCSICVGGETGLTACIFDCAGEWGGSALEDNCGVCDNDPYNDCSNDCAGTPGGDLQDDECGVCGGDDSTCTDECGVPNGDNSTCLDCNDVPNGDALEDNCGVCDISPSNDCVQDCYGAWGGSAELDECGVCGGNGPPDNYNCAGQCTAGLDCNGNCGGTAVEDECGVCGGNGPPENYNCDLECIAGIDCAGVCGGFVVDDVCGTCGGTNTDPANCVCPDGAIMDCAGVCGGTTVEDECGVCGGNGPPENYNCALECTAGIDCNGECGGNAVEDECGVCYGNGSSCESDCAAEVCLSIENVNTPAGSLDIYMTNQAGCSYCEDPAYNNNNFNWTDLKEPCESSGSTWIVDTGLTASDCAEIPSLAETGGWYFDGSVKGFQFELFGMTLSGLSGGSAGEYLDYVSYNASTGLILGASFWSGPIPIGEGVLTQVSFYDYEDGYICFGTDPANNVLSDALGGSIWTDWGECYSGGGCASGIYDCNGVCDGSAVEDNCAVCDNDTTNDCVQDCAGTWGGILVEDACGTCGGSITDATQCACPPGQEVDCTGVCGGSAYIDGCGNCVHGNTGMPDCLIIEITSVTLSPGTVYELPVYLHNLSSPLEGLIITFDYNPSYLTINSFTFSGAAIDNSSYELFFNLEEGHSDLAIYNIANEPFFSDSTSHIFNIQLETANVEEIINTQINIQSLQVNEYSMSDENWVNGDILIATFGCTDPEAFNYDESANWDDGSCEYGIFTDILITEFFFQSEGNIYEYIEIFNATSATINLMGWKIDIDDIEYSIDDSLSINSFDYVVLVSFSGVFQTSEGTTYCSSYNPHPIFNNCGNPRDDLYWLQFSGLSNESGEIKLLDSDGNLIDEVIYSSADGFPVGDEIIGQAAEYILYPLADSATYLNDNGNNWQSSQNVSDWLWNGTNYEYGSPLAGYDEGGVVYSCTDPEACNYNPDADYDNGSCWWPNDLCECEHGEGALADYCGECNGNGYDACDEDGDGMTNLEQWGYGAYNINIVDVPNDQGGWVNMSFHSSFYDTDTIVTRSELYTIELLDDTTWVVAQSFGAYGVETYSALLPTLFNNDTTEFRIIANMDEGNFLSTQNGFGASIDNIFPAVPTGLMASIEDESVVLNWDQPVDADFQYFTIYKNGELIEYSTESTYTENVYGQNDYYITATDANGNESEPSESITVQLTVNQTVQTGVGWNWFSINVESDDMSVNNVLSNLDPIPGDFIKSQEGSAEYYAEFGWYGGLENINIMDMYQLDIENGGTIAFTGYPADPENTIIHLTDGWNWIGYIPQNSGAIDLALNTIGDSGIFIKNQTASAEYYDGFGWFGSLDYMAPGDGYQLQIIGEADLVYPNFEADDGLIRTKEVKVLPASISEWVVNPHAYEFNGAITLSVDNREDSPGDYIAAFVDDECRGIAERMDFPFDNVDRGIYILMAYSNMKEEEEITFKYFSDSEEEVIEYTESLEFTLDMVIGNGFKPFSLSREFIIPTEFSLSAAYPNPFNPVTTLSFAIPVDSEVSLSIYNLQGREVSTLISGNMDAGYHSVVWNANSAASGVYFVKMVAGEYVSNQKLMLIK